jgi:hypothetical protein
MESVDFQQTTRPYSPEDRTLHNHSYEKVKFSILKLYSSLNEFVVDRALLYYMTRRMFESRIVTPETRKKKITQTKM